MNFTFQFPVVKGTQAGRAFYIAMVPLKMLKKIFSDDDEYVPPEFRAQRKLNLSRVPVISKYILSNRDSYVFSALAASIDGEFQFIPSINPDIGVLEISIEAKILINDGQHRKAAILKALEEDETLADETIPVVLFADLGLIRSQQMFTDLNKHAVKTSNSIAELYDSRDDLAVTTRELVFNNPFLNQYTDKEKDNLGKYSSHLFTLSAFYKANKRIFSGTKSQDPEFLVRYWSCIIKHMLPWQELLNREITKRDLRENYIATQNVLIYALGRLGNYFYTHPEIQFEEVLVELEKINWRRNSICWVGRAIKNGKMITNDTAIILTCNLVKNTLGIELDDVELEREQEFTKRS